MTVLCLVEHDDDGVTDMSLRAMRLARTFGPELVSAVAVGRPGPAALDALAAHGAGQVHVLDFGARPAGYAPLEWARALRTLLELTGASAVVAPASDRGTEVCAHLAAIAGLAMVANCLAVSTEGDHQWRITRQRWAGSLLEDCILDEPTAVITVAIDAPAAVPVEVPGPATVREHRPEMEEDKLVVRATESRQPSSGATLATAKVVVSGGRGIGSSEGFAAVEEVAALLGGAVGVSRAVTSLGWRPHREQVGQTGTRVTPDLYVACGISGAIQHLAGCHGAKHMVAINTDPDAPIMSRADYAVIGDANEILPALAIAIRSHRQTG